MFKLKETTKENLTRLLIAILIAVIVVITIWVLGIKIDPRITISS